MSSANSAGQIDILSQIFQGLKNRNADTRLAHALELRRHVTTTVAEMSSDAAAKLWDDNINRRLFELMHSPNNNERWGGLVAIENLVDIESEDMKRNLFRFYNYVRLLLPNSETGLMVAASKTIGIIADVGSTVSEAGLGESFLDFEVPAAIDLMQADRQEWSRYAGVLILKELAKNSPTYFHSHVGIVFDKIGIPLKDKRLNVREGAAELLSACLDIVISRERGARSPFFTKVLQEAQVGLRHTQPEVIHGSLLAYKMLLLHGGMFMKENFIDSAEQILRFKMHSDTHVRKIVITLIPTLAAYDTSSFTEHFLHRSMAHLLSQVERLTEKTVASMAFVAIGHTAVAVGSDMKRFLESVMAQIKQALQMRG
jgi:FKBP12-rapamycin complex-associated protein